MQHCNYTLSHSYTQNKVVSESRDQHTKHYGLYLAKVEVCIDVVLRIFSHICRKNGYEGHSTSVYCIYEAVVVEPNFEMSDYVHYGEYPGRITWKNFVSKFRFIGNQNTEIRKFSLEFSKLAHRLVVAFFTPYSSYGNQSPWTFTSM